MDLSLPMLEIAIKYDVEPQKMRSTRMRVTSEEQNNVAFQHGF